MHWSVAELAEATGGSVAGPRHGGVTGIAIDSRSMSAGELFVALRGERDGHEFVPAAIAAGAGGVLVDAGRQPKPDQKSDGPEAQGDLIVIEVADTGQALLSLGSAARSRLSAEVVGITGSVGKTSTKDLIAAALSASKKVTSSERSFNNEIGVPLTLANAPLDTEVAVIEMGARGPGHIALLCEVARPSIAVVTAVVAAHTEAFGGLEAIAEAKGELVGALPPGGTPVLNADDPRVKAMVTRAPAHSAAPLLYSAAGLAGADLIAEDASVDAELRPSFMARTPWGSSRVTLEARGLHQVGNALAALAVAGACGVELESAVSSLRHARLSPWRMEVSRTAAGTTVINDAYNSNPTSLSAALYALAELPVSRRIAVLGEMAELGERSEAEHLKAARSAADLGIELVAVGTDAYGVTPARNVDEALDVLARKGLGDEDAVLVKASRVAGLERLAARLLADD